MGTSGERNEDYYIGREQTLVKHIILERYLERFAHIIGYHRKSITYVDCFAGPWNLHSNDLSDSSFSIALRELRKARDDLADHNKHFSIRCFFLESETDPYLRLKAFADEVQDAEIETKNATLEDSIADICAFVKGEPSTFSFFFVDPTGWKIPIDVLKPLFQFNPCEVLVNFMTSFIVRFAEDERPELRPSFEGLFGSGQYRDRIAGKTGLDREDELVRCYVDTLREAGGFKHICPSIVLHPKKNRTHFHLIYATRHPKGVEEFKKAEKNAMKSMEGARADARQRRRIAKTGQAEFDFGNGPVVSGEHYDDLRERYLGQARSELLSTFQERRRMAYDEAWELAMQFPLVWESDLKAWIEDWKEAGKIHLEGLSPGDRVPKREKGHSLIYQH